MSKGFRDLEILEKDELHKGARVRAQIRQVLFATENQYSNGIPGWKIKEFVVNRFQKDCPWYKNKPPRIINRLRDLRSPSCKHCNFFDYKKEREVCPRCGGSLEPPLIETFQGADGYTWARLIEKENQK